MRNRHHVACLGWCTPLNPQPPPPISQDVSRLLLLLTAAVQQHLLRRHDGASFLAALLPLCRPDEYVYALELLVCASWSPAHT